MDRLEAAKYIKAHCLGSEVCRDGTRWNDAMMTAVEALEGKDTNVPTWIPFTAETMPKEDGEYFVLYDDKYAEDYDTGRVGVADFYEDCEAFGYWQSRYDPVTFGFVDSDFIEIKVKKWMPIPIEE